MEKSLDDVQANEDDTSVDGVTDTITDRIMIPHWPAEAHMLYPSQPSQMIISSTPKMKAFLECSPASTNIIKKKTDKIKSF